MRKSFLEEHHRNWVHGILTDLLTVAVGYATLCANALPALQPDPEERWVSEDENSPRKVDLVASIVEMLAWIVEPTTSFGLYFRDTPIPPACPVRVQDLAGLASLAKEDRPSWAMLVCLKFDTLDGWHLLCEVCHLYTSGGYLQGCFWPSWTLSVAKQLYVHPSGPVLTPSSGRAFG